MNIREASSIRRTYAQAAKGKNEIQPKRRSAVVLISLLFLAGLLSWLFLGITHAGALGSPVKSGWSGYCLDDYLSKVTSGNQVDLWQCNSSSAQQWQVNLTQIIHDSNLCLTAKSTSSITLEECSQDANQVWLRDNHGFLNPNSGLCLEAAKNSDGQGLSLGSCNNLADSSETWSPNIDYATYPCAGTQGDKVACYAIKEWVNWTTEPNNHQALLNKYTGGTPYEEWCADFVSYIYREAGYPFSHGNYGGWDENLAPAIVNQGFTTEPRSGFVPKPGDVGFFDYTGGHVEIVVSGGKTPTFIYGNSGTNDPTTGNGDMAANTITSDPALGALQYYLSPNSST